MVNMWAITHDERVWVEPGKFMPEGFMEDVSIMGSDIDGKKGAECRGRRVTPVGRKDNANKKKNQKIKPFCLFYVYTTFFTSTCVSVCMGKTYMQTIMVYPIHKQALGSWCLPNDGLFGPF